MPNQTNYIDQDLRAKYQTRGFSHNILASLPRGTCRAKMSSSYNLLIHL